MKSSTLDKKIRKLVADLRNIGVNAEIVVIASIGKKQDGTGAYLESIMDNAKNKSAKSGRIISLTKIGIKKKVTMNMPN